MADLLAKYELSKEKMFLSVAGMIGSNTRLQLLDTQAGVTKILATKAYRSKKFLSLTEMIEHFLQEQLGSKEDWPKSCCLTIPQPVVNNECRFMGIRHWPKLSGEQMSSDLRIPHLVLVNDFVSVGYSLLELDKHDYTVLSTGTPQPNACIACVGAGIGLGECFLAWNGKEYDSFPTEGGHGTFSAQNPEEWRLREHIAERMHLDHVSIERVVSWSGIVNIYNFLCHEHPEEANSALEQRLQADMRERPGLGSPIVEFAEKERTSLAARAVRLFVASYATEAGNMALKTLAFGGVYLAGGIAPKVLWAIKEDDRFMKNFMRQGRMQQLVSGCPVFLIHEGVDVGLLGAQTLCKRLLQKAAAGNLTRLVELNDREYKQKNCSHK
eukprot:g60725.t1